MASALGLTSVFSDSPFGFGAVAELAAGACVALEVGVGAAAGAGACPLETMAINTIRKAGWPILRVLCEGACPEPVEGWDSTAACIRSVAQRFSAAKKWAHMQRALAPEAQHLAVIRPPPHPRAPSWSAESASIPTR